jgi:excisionase family DNA binding protein
VEDKNRMKLTIWEAAEYLGLTPTTVQEMVQRGVLKADKFAQHLTPNLVHLSDTPTPLTGVCCSRYVGPDKARRYRAHE